MLKGKKVLSLLLALCLTAGTLSTLAFAVPEGYGIELSSELSSSGTLTASLKASLPKEKSSLTSVGVYVIYDKTKLTLMNGNNEVNTAGRVDEAVIPVVKDSLGKAYKSISELSFSGNEGVIFASLIPQGNEVNSLSAGAIELLQIKFKPKGAATAESLKGALRFADPSKDTSKISTNKIGSKSLAASLMSENQATDYYYGVFKSIPSNGAQMSKAVVTDPVERKGLLGDVNADGDVNMGDVQRLFNHVMGDTLQDLSLSDVNADGDVNMGDVQRLFNHVMGTDPLK